MSNGPEDTCVGERCVFFKKYMNPEENTICPFYLETTWAPEGSMQPKLIKDCAPKRSLLLQLEGTSRIVGIQKDFEEQRNKHSENTQVMLHMAQAFDHSLKGIAKQIDIDYDGILQIELVEEKPEIE
jgi:hypothetical protein